MKNLIKINLKKRAWLFAIFGLIAFLCRPMMQLMTYENTMKYNIPEVLLATMEDFFLPDVFTDFIPALMASVVFAIVFFSYLFSKKQVDLYHSIPVDRKHLFISNYLSGIIVYLVILFSEFIICMAVAIANHYMTARSFSNMFIAIVCNIVHFVFGYSVVVSAIMLTGNMIISLALSAVMGLIYPITVTLLKSFEGYFYVTNYNCGVIKPDLIEKYYWLSPIVSYASFISRVNNTWNDFYYESVGQMYAALIAPIIMSVLFIAFAYYLYMNRPSEAAGRALAFKKSQSIIRIPVSIVGGFAGTWFMSSSVNSYKTSWIWFGMILGVVVTHCVLECIFNESFRAVLTHKKQLFITLLLTAGIILIFYNDFLNYDKYLPKREKIKAAAVYFEDIDNYINHIELKEDPKNPGSYESTSYLGLVQAYNCNIEDKIYIDKVYALSQAGVSSVDDMIDQKIKDNTGAAYYEYRETEEAYDEVFLDGSEAMQGDNLDLIDSEEAYKQALLWMEAEGITELNHDEERKLTAEVCFTLMNGKKVLRKYDIPLSKALAYVAEIYNTEEYNKAHFDLYDGYDKGAIFKVDVYDSFENKQLSLSAKEKDEFMKAYLSDLENIKLDTVSKIPIGRVAPFYKTAGIYDESYSGYYLYKEFNRTIAYMESLGVDMSTFTTEVKASDIESMTMSSYNKYGYSDDSTIFIDEIIYTKEEDQDVIKEIAKDIMNSTNYWSNELLINSVTKSDSAGVDIMVYYTPERGVMKSFSVMLKDGVIPERLKKDLIIKMWKDNQF